MSTERTMKMGQLAELQEQLRRLENRADGILGNIRLEAMPAPLSGPFDLDAQRIRDYADEFLGVSGEGRRVLAAIDKLKGELGLA